MPATFTGATDAAIGVEAAGCESEADAPPDTPIGDAGATDATVDIDAFGRESEADAAPVTSSEEDVAVTGAMLDADAGACAVESWAASASGEAAAAEAVCTAANG